MTESEQKAFIKVINTIEKRQLRRIRRGMLAAGSAACIAVLALGVFFSRPTPQPEITQTIFCCQDGNSSTVTLPDNSTIKLIGDATLVQSSDFSAENRKVRLSGEALFDITTDAEHPFEVLTPEDCKVKVFGTQFNLDASENSDQLTLVLLRGKVAFESTNVKCDVAPGEMIRYSSKTGNFNKSAISVNDYSLWMEGKIAYDNITLEAFAKRLEGIYGVRIVLSDEISNLPKTFSISLKNREDLASVLEAVEVLLPVSCESAEGTVHIHNRV